jgi:hypothetical protein
LISSNMGDLSPVILAFGKQLAYFPNLSTGLANICFLNTSSNP